MFSLISAHAFYNLSPVCLTFDCQSCKNADSLVLSLAHEPALTRFTACYAGCSFANGTRKTNAAFGVACFSFVLSLAHEPALTRFTACYAGCSFANGTRKTNAAFGVACFSFVLIIS